MIDKALEVTHSYTSTGFDAFADNYDASLQSGLNFTGENKIYFVRGRLAWLRAQFSSLGFVAQRILDFGCGCGDTCRYFFDLLNAREYVGVDISSESIKLANLRQQGAHRRFLPLDDLIPASDFDLVYCNGVFHHIKPALRHSAAQYVAQSLRPGGLFAFWENNPWNPATRWVMRRIPFDHDAIMLSARESRRLLRSAGFEILATHYLFIFPNALRWFRSIELGLARVPFGGQYLVLARRLDQSGLCSTNQTCARVGRY
jgi:SAM-dependent methyltransferase